MSRVARAARGMALALGLTAAFAMPAYAAQWSLAPTLDWSADNDSNRSLVAQGESSRSTSLTATAVMKRETETTQLSLSPQLRWQLFDRSTYGNIFERDLNGAGSWTGERANASLALVDADRSTLTTEATQTGVLSANLHQRLDEATLSSVFNQSERYALVAQLGYSDVSYYGTAEGALINLLQGYRYPTASLGERYQLSDIETITASVYRNEVRAPLTDNTYDTGLELEYHRSLSERYDLDATAGAAQVETMAGKQISGTGSLDLSRTYSLGSLTLAYSRSLLPYGTGVLVDRQEASLSGTRGITEKLHWNASANWVQNGQPFGRSPGQPAFVQVQTYVSAQLGLSYQPAETWRFDADVSGTRTRTIETVSQPVHEWRVWVSVTWTPHPFLSGF